MSCHRKSPGCQPKWHSLATLKKKKKAVPIPTTMQDYIEQQLTELHYSAVGNNFPNKFIAFVVTIFLAVLMPYLHIGKRVDRALFSDKNSWSQNCLSPMIHTQISLYESLLEYDYEE